MSHIIKFKTRITDAERLKKAWAYLKQHDKEFANVGEIQTRQVGGNTQCMLKLPGWLQEATFFCDEQGRMDADNYSQYTEDHPDVKAGRKRLGAEGRWGDIKYLERLQTAYGAIPHLEEAERQGHVADMVLNPQDNTAMITIDIYE